MIQQSNFKARQSINKQYAQIKGASSINDVALGFGKGWIAFAVLSSMASAFSFYQDFNQSLGVIVTILLVVVLAVALEGFKHLSIKGMFSDMHILSRSLVSVVAIGLIGISFYTHYKSIQTFQKNLVSTDLKSEISYQRDLQKIQNGQIESILATNHELAKAINNGDTADDVLSSRSQQSNNELIKTLQTLSAQNNMHNTTLLLEQSRSTAKTTASAILVIFIMIEIMALFSILSKIIVIDNVSENVKGFFGLIDRLDELETNTYESLGYQKIEQTQAKIQAVKGYQEQLHQRELKAIGYNSPTLSSKTRENIAFDANIDTSGYMCTSTPYPALDEGKENINDSSKRRNNKNIRDVVEKTEINIGEEPKLTKNGSMTTQNDVFNKFDDEFIEKDVWDSLSSEQKKTASSHIDITMYQDRPKFLRMLNLMFNKGRVKKFNESLIPKTECVRQFREDLGGTINDAKDIYQEIAEDLLEGQEIIMKGRYKNRCQGIKTLVAIG